MLSFTKLCLCFRKNEEDFTLMMMTTSVGIMSNVVKHLEQQSLSLDFAAVAAISQQLAETGPNLM